MIQEFRVWAWAALLLRVKYFKCLEQFCREQAVAFFIHVNAIPSQNAAVKILWIVLFKVVDKDLSKIDKLRAGLFGDLTVVPQMGACVSRWMTMPSANRAVGLISARAINGLVRAIPKVNKVNFNFIFFAFLVQFSYLQG